MTYEEPAVAKTSRYPITEAAKILGISRSTLLRYVNQGLIIPQYKRATHRKIFTGEQLLKLWKTYV